MPQEASYTHGYRADVVVVALYCSYMASDPTVRACSGEPSFFTTLGSLCWPQTFRRTANLRENATFGARESLDAAAAMAYLRDAVPGERVGVIGVSMGGAATLLGPGPLSANAFVLESVYPTIRDAVSDRLATWFGPFSGIGRWFTSAVIGVVGSEIGVSEAELQPIDRIGHIGAPLLLLSGTDDHYTPLAEAESLYAHAPAKKSFWAVVGAGHEDLHDYGRAEYERRVGGFLARCLRAGTAALPNTGC